MSYNVKNHSKWFQKTTFALGIILHNKVRGKIIWLNKKASAETYNYCSQRVFETTAAILTAVNRLERVAVDSMASQADGINHLFIDLKHLLLLPKRFFFFRAQRLEKVFLSSPQAWRFSVVYHSRLVWFRLSFAVSLVVNLEITNR